LAAGPLPTPHGDLGGSPPVPAVCRRRATAHQDTVDRVSQGASRGAEGAGVHALLVARRRWFRGWWRCGLRCCRRWWLPRRRRWSRRGRSGRGRSGRGGDDYRNVRRRGAWRRRRGRTGARWCRAGGDHGRRGRVGLGGPVHGRCNRGTSAAQHEKRGDEAEDQATLADPLCRLRGRDRWIACGGRVAGRGPAARVPHGRTGTRCSGWSEHSPVPARLAIRVNRRRALWSILLSRAKSHPAMVALRGHAVTHPIGQSTLV